MMCLPSIGDSSETNRWLTSLYDKTSHIKYIKATVISEIILKETEFDDTKMKIKQNNLSRR